MSALGSSWKASNFEKASAKSVWPPCICPSTIGNTSEEDLPRRPWFTGGMIPARICVIAGRRSESKRNTTRSAREKYDSGASLPANFSMSSPATSRITRWIVDCGSVIIHIIESRW